MKTERPFLEINDVKKVYQMESVKVEALRGVNFSVRRGEFIAIVGTSGSGKSTLMHIMGLLDRPTQGKVMLAGVDVRKLNDDRLAEYRGKKIGFVFQFFNLYPTLTARQNIELPLSIQGYGKSEKERRARELLKSVGLSDREDSLPSQLSGGQRQRVAIARSLATNPEIILADEPTGNLDSQTGKEVIDMLVKINKEVGRTVVIVTHDSHIARHANRIIEIRDGKVISDRKHKKFVRE